MTVLDGIAVPSATGMISSATPVSLLAMGFGGLLFAGRMCGTRRRH